jgi:hypothetical protein
MQSDDPLDTIESFMFRISKDTCEIIVDQEKINLESAILNYN